MAKSMIDLNFTKTAVKTNSPQPTTSSSSTKKPMSNTDVKAYLASLRGGSASRPAVPPKAVQKTGTKPYSEEEEESLPKTKSIAKSQTKRATPKKEESIEFSDISPPTSSVSTIVPDKKPLAVVEPKTETKHLPAAPQKSQERIESPVAIDQSIEETDIHSVSSIKTELDDSDKSDVPEQIHSLASILSSIQEQETIGRVPDPPPVTTATIYVDDFEPDVDEASTNAPSIKSTSSDKSTVNSTIFTKHSTKTASSTSAGSSSSDSTIQNTTTPTTTERSAAKSVHPRKSSAKMARSKSSSSEASSQESVKVKPSKKKQRGVSTSAAVRHKVTSADFASQTIMESGTQTSHLHQTLLMNVNLPSETDQNRHDQETYQNEATKELLRSLLLSHLHMMRHFAVEQYRLHQQWTKMVSQSIQPDQTQPAQLDDPKPSKKSKKNSRRKR